MICTALTVVHDVRHCFAQLVACRWRRLKLVLWITGRQCPCMHCNLSSSPSTEMEECVNSEYRCGRKCKELQIHTKQLKQNAPEF